VAAVSFEFVWAFVALGFVIIWLLGRRSS